MLHCSLFSVSLQSVGVSEDSCKLQVWLGQQRNGLQHANNTMRRFIRRNYTNIEKPCKIITFAYIQPNDLDDTDPKQRIVKVLSIGQGSVAPLGFCFHRLWSLRASSRPRCFCLHMDTLLFCTWFYIKPR